MNASQYELGALGVRGKESSIRRGCSSSVCVAGEEVGVKVRLLSRAIDGVTSSHRLYVCSRKNLSPRKGSEVQHVFKIWVI